MFKDCITIVHKCHNCEIYDRKIRAPLAPLHPITIVGPFAKWGIDFITCNPHSVRGAWIHYPCIRLLYDEEIAIIFIFNHVISLFSVPQAIVTNHGSNFCNFMMVKLSSQLVLHHDSYTLYYPQVNGQVEVVNKILTNIIKWIVCMHKGNWHSMLFLTLWAYCTTIKISINFTPFQLIYGLETILPIECEIPSLKIEIKLLPATSADEERFIHLAHLDENHCDVVLASEAH